MKYEINGETNDKKLVDLLDDIECAASNSTAFAVTAEGLRYRADTMMHIAADIHANADRLASEFNS